MNMHSEFRFLCVVAVLVLMGGVYTALPARAESSAAITVLLDARDTAGLAWLHAADAIWLADYGSFSLWELPETSALRLLSAIPTSLRWVNSRINFRGLVLDGTSLRPEPLIPPSLQAVPVKSGTKRLWLLQFAGPLQDTWFDELRADGQIVVGCFDGNACILWGTSMSVETGPLGQVVRWQGEYHPVYRLHPDLRPGGSLKVGGGEVEVTVQLLDVPEAYPALVALRGLAVHLDQAPNKVINMLNIRARIEAGRLDQAAALAPVVNIEPFHQPQKFDELQVQILAGNVSLNGVKIQGYEEYLAWLNSAGLPTDPEEYPIIDIIDDGIDQGNASEVLHPDFFELGSTSNLDRVPYLQSCLENLSANGVGGHGNLNAGIAGGYNNGIGFPYADAYGPRSSFRYGLGVSPYGRLAGTKVFTDAGYFDVVNCANSYSGVVKKVYTSGGRISNNSWGDNTARGAYDAGAQEYDALTRDADPTLAGNQEMLHIFSAGNDGSSGSGSVGSPATAKNVLTVGATDFPRAGGTAENLAWYSSLGPTDDMRTKPDLVAPGSAIMGPASMDPLYNGTGVWAKYYPAGMEVYKLYTYSYGTSHSAPAVAGAAQLVYADYTAAHGGTNPSPAMVKALLINNTKYLNGDRTGGNLPSNAQGWGMPDLARTFGGNQPLLIDQTVVFSGSGETHSWLQDLSSHGEDLRVTLTWTDAPGSTVSRALVNNLDLEVIVDGVSYQGNVFAGAYSSLNGLADATNNVESVFLPSYQYDQMEIRVTASNITGDGIPGNSDPTDQDFALVVTSMPGTVIYFPIVGH